MVGRGVACPQEAHGVRKQGLRGGQVVLKDLVHTGLQLLGLVEAEGESLANLVHVDGTVPAAEEFHGGRQPFVALFCVLVSMCVCVCMSMCICQK